MDLKLHWSTIVKYSKLFLIFFLTSFICLHAQGIIPKVVANSEVRLNLDNPVGSASKYNYAIGETLTLYVDTKRDGYLYVINVEADNKSFLLFPNDLNSQDSYLHAGEHILPPREENYAFHITKKTPLGSHRIIALISSLPLSQEELSELKTELSTQQNTSLLQHNGIFWGDASFHINASPSNTSNVVAPSTPSSSNAIEPNAPSTNTNIANTSYSDQANHNQLGGLVINSLPSGASVLLDGQVRGRTPLAISAELGKHQVKIELSGYQSYEVEVMLDPKQSTILDVPLTGYINNPVSNKTDNSASNQTGNQAEAPILSLSPSSPPQTNFGGLIIGSSPSGAEIILNGQVFGHTPLSSSLTAGKYTIKLETYGYSSLEKTIEIVPSKTLEINEALIPDTWANSPQQHTNLSASNSNLTSSSTSNLNTGPSVSNTNTFNALSSTGLLDVPELKVNAYPNSNIVSQRNTANYFEAVFETNDTIQQTFSHFDEQLVNNSLKRRFQHSFFDIENNIYNVVYTLSTGKRITMILSHQKSERLLELVFESPEQVMR